MADGSAALPDDVPRHRRHLHGEPTVDERGGPRLGVPRRDGVDHGDCAELGGLVGRCVDRDLADVTAARGAGLGAWQTQSTSGAADTQLWNLVVTGSLISIIPLIISFLALQKYWQSGLSLGSIK